MPFVGERCPKAGYAGRAAWSSRVRGILLGQMGGKFPGNPLYSENGISEIQTGHTDGESPGGHLGEFYPRVPTLSGLNHTVDEAAS